MDHRQFDPARTTDQPKTKAEPAQLLEELNRQVDRAKTPKCNVDTNTETLAAPNINKNNPQEPKE